MNPRTRLKREIIRLRRREPWPQLFTRITAPDGMSVRATLYPHHGRITADYRAGGHLTHEAWPPAPAVFSELRHLIDFERSITCWDCLNTGAIDIHHHSTDAVIGWRPCPSLNNKRKHPPATPVPLAVTTVAAHTPECDGSGRINCCPPF